MQVGSGSTEAESKDRATLGLPDAQQRLLEAVRSAMRAASPAGMLVVVVISAGPVYLDPACADAILYAGYPGMEAGHGIADVIFGRVSPSARFPVTVYDSQAEQEHWQRRNPQSLLQRLHRIALPWKPPADFYSSHIMQPSTC